MQDPFDMLALYGNDQEAQAAELGTNMPFLQGYQEMQQPNQLQQFNQPVQNTTPVSTGGISSRIQELLGAKQPNEPGLIENILSSRFGGSSGGTSYGDYAQGAIQSALGTPTLGSQVASTRQAGVIKQMEDIARIEQLQGQAEGYSSGRISNKPAAIQEYEFVSKLSPEDQLLYMSVKRPSLGIRTGSTNNSNAPALNTGFGKPPIGYRFNDAGNLDPIPGGPGEKISAELSARLGLAKKFLKESPDLQTQIKKGTATGLIDYAQGAMGFGESGALQRRIADGADALQRMLTGAGMPASEAADYSNRFRATYKDNSNTLLDKVTNLDTVLRAQIEMASRGHGDILGDLSTGGQGQIAPPTPEEEAYARQMGWTK